MGTYKCCLIFKRKYRWTDAPPPEDVRSLFSHHSDGAATMGAEGLRRYLDSTGGTGTDPDFDADAEAERLLDQIRQAQRARVPRVGRPHLGLDDFHRFLFSDDLNPPLRRPQVHHDMALPLSHYYIYTGHNSYLTGNQLSSDCSDVPIIKALQRGVRVIELDMWPNSNKDDINILHGRLLLILCRPLLILFSIYIHPTTHSLGIFLFGTIEENIQPNFCFC
jgi:phosphatidylinositol phospholipase C delta